MELLNTLDILEIVEFMTRNVDDNILNKMKFDVYNIKNTIIIGGILLINCKKLINALINEEYDNNYDYDYEYDYEYEYKYKYEFSSTIKEMKKNGEITPEVLLITYILLNHELYWSRNEIMNDKLRKHTCLIELFIEQGLEKELLCLAITGERLRDLSYHIRDYHDILHENISVVKYLVPRYILPSKPIYYTADNFELLPIEYWYYFSNNTMSISPPFETDTFEKNKDILLYLEKSLEKVNNAALKIQKYYMNARDNPENLLCKKINKYEYDKIIGVC
jgi:hypothetical protein